MEILHGDVVASSTSTYYVQEVDSGGLTVLRIQTQGPVRHRADVAPEHWSDVALSGLQFNEVVIRCVPIRRFTSCNLTRLGCLSPGLRKQIQTALNREMLVRRFEDSPPMRSNLDASTSSRGRRGDCSSLRLTSQTADGTAKPVDRTKTPIVKRTDRFLVALAKSGNLTLACRAGGLTRRDVETLRSQRPDFDVAFKDALEEAADILEAEAWRRALEGVAQPVIKAGQLVLDPDTEKPLMVRRYSDALLMLLLRSNKPAKFQRSLAVFPQDDTAQIIKEIAADEDPPRHECDAALANQ